MKSELVDDPDTFYPSVKCGPLDCRKAISLLGWKPTPLVFVLYNFKFADCSETSY